VLRLYFTFLAMDAHLLNFHFHKMLRILITTNSNGTQNPSEISQDHFQCFFQKGLHFILLTQDPCFLKYQNSG
jgi:hypothetical protein